MFRVAFAVALLLAAPSFAQSAEPANVTKDITSAPAPIIEFPENYRASATPQTPPGRESAQALNGNTYTVLTPIFDGTGGNTSYVRLGNVNQTAVTISVTIVGSPSGRVYGVASFVIPPYASQQKSIHDILSAANVTPGYIAPDTIYALYLTTSAPAYTGYQHIIHNGSSRFFENMSICTFRSGVDYSALNQLLANVHTDHELMKDYPTQVGIHHYGSAPASYRVDVFVSETGEWKGAFSFTMQPNETYIAPMSWYEQAVNWTPVFGESHANLLFNRNDLGQYQAVVGQAVYNIEFDAYVNMTQLCGINNSY